MYNTNPTVFPPLKSPQGDPTQRFGKYSVEQKIGHGAMGEVWKARDEVLNRSVALKTIAASSTFADSELLRRFRQEAQAAAGLNHPNIVTVYDFAEAEGRLFLVMELLEGADLQDLIRDRRLPTLRQKVELMQKIADGMAYAHGQGFIHRDLKPANIRVLPDGTPKIMDFGLARAREAELTRTGRIVGTPHYMSPEQIRNETIDSRSDVFALGVMFYELLAGRRPFPATDLHGVLFQILQREPDPLQALSGGVLDHILTFALSKQPENRYRDAGDLRKALGQIDLAALDAAPAAAMPASAPVSVPSSLPGAPAAGVPAAAAPAAAVPATVLPPGSGSTPSLSASLSPGLSTGTSNTPPCRVVFRQEKDGDRELWHRDSRQSLLDISLQNGVDHYHECGGRARCSSCRIRVLSGLHNLEPRTTTEERMAQRMGWGDDVRLACQTRIKGDVEVKRLVHDTQDLGLMVPRGGQTPTPSEKAVAVLSCELLDFEQHMDSWPAYDLFHILNRFYLQIGEAVIATGGHIESYTHAGFRAFFGLDGGSAREKCLTAVRAAVRALARMAPFSQYTSTFFGTEMRLGIGLDFTRVIVGQLGHPSKTEVAALGPAAAMACRLNDVNRRGGTTVLASEGLVNVIEDELHLGRVLSDEQVGDKVLTLYEVMDLRLADAAFLVQRSFELCESRVDEMAEIFYGKLFTVAPQLQALFANTDMKMQRRMLMDTLTAAIRGLDEMDSLVPVLRELGQRHVAYGTQLAHYEVLGPVLLETVEQMIGEEFSEDVKLAWTKIYGAIVHYMTDGIDYGSAGHEGLASGMAEAASYNAGAGAVQGGSHPASMA